MSRCPEGQFHRTNSAGTWPRSSPSTPTAERRPRRAVAAPPSWLLTGDDAYLRRESAVARSAKKSAVPEMQVIDIPRPPTPKRYKASKDEPLQLIAKVLLICRFEERAGSFTGSGSSRNRPRQEQRLIARGHDQMAPAGSSQHRGAGQSHARRRTRATWPNASSGISMAGPHVVCTVALLGRLIPSWSGTSPRRRPSLTTPPIPMDERQRSAAD